MIDAGNAPRPPLFEWDRQARADCRQLGIAEAVAEQIAANRHKMRSPVARGYVDGGPRDGALLDVYHFAKDADTIVIYAVELVDEIVEEESHDAI